MFMAVCMCGDTAKHAVPKQLMYCHHPVCIQAVNKTEQSTWLGGDSHSMFLTSSGTVYSWGNNFEGQLGHGKSVKFLSKPTQLNSSLLPGQVVSVSVGENTSAAVTGMLNDQR
ncbi:putative E3 ubiquitin-protein ligase herc1 [Desmophyllum pertusum]|uniref:E3 ubiquitin-protein ligase herc1 n=1 Tax=Desmophyllum pertusum TaxID=174260 RepID=A0A9W9Y6X0_9CNID|nr:putative E3 ubiquitin-protein ligase herc1 [Desmophyllum pertusum]